MAVSPDLIPGTALDTWLLAVAGLAVALTTIARAWNRTPFTQIRRAVAWGFRQLIGNPLGNWLKARVREATIPTIKAELASDEMHAVIVEVAAKVNLLAIELRTHMEDEGATVQDTRKLAVATHDLAIDTNSIVRDLAETTKSHGERLTKLEVR